MNKLTLPPDTPIEVVAVHLVTLRATTKQMTFRDWINLKRNPKFRYEAGQVGFLQYAPQTKNV
jgi:hypothetical protein